MDALGGCTASRISPHQLLVVHQHCIYGAVQFNSTVECNLM